MIRVTVDMSSQELEKSLNQIEETGGNIMQILVHANRYGSARYTTIYRTRKAGERGEH